MIKRLGHLVVSPRSDATGKPYMVIEQMTEDGPYAVPLGITLYADEITIDDVRQKH